jgi:hypothetical protein
MSIEIDRLQPERITAKGRVSLGWRVGAKTACYTGTTRFDWPGAKGRLTVSIFPRVSDRSLIEAPSLRRTIGNANLLWRFDGDRFDLELLVRKGEGWNRSLHPESAGATKVKLLAENAFRCDGRDYIARVVITFDHDNPNRDLVWWQPSSGASAGRPSGGKRR